MNDPKELYPPKPHIVQNAHISSMAEYQRLYRLSLDDPETFWAKQAERLTWFHPWNEVFDHDYDNVDFGWFLGGRPAGLRWRSRRVVLRRRGFDRESLRS